MKGVITLDGARKRVMVKAADVRVGDEINVRGGDFAEVEKVTRLPDGMVQIEMAERGVNPIYIRAERQIPVHR